MRRLICILFPIILFIGCKPEGITINKFLFENQDYKIWINGRIYDVNNFYNHKYNSSKEIILQVQKQQNSEPVDEVFIDDSCGWVKFKNLPYEVLLLNCG